MPGMMDTVLNLGLNDRSVLGLAAQTNDERFAYDSYRRRLAGVLTEATGQPNDIVVFDQVSAAVATIPRNYAFVALAVVGVGTIFAKAFAGRHGSPLQGGAISGHAALAFSGATLITVLAPTFVVGVLAFFLAFLVSQSRVEGGIHTFREVALGAALGIVVTGALFLAVRV